MLSYIHGAQVNYNTNQTIDMAIQYIRLFNILPILTFERSDIKFSLLRHDFLNY